jgi:hypothetical protein
LNQIHNWYSLLLGMPTLPKFVFQDSNYHDERLYIYFVHADIYQGQHEVVDTQFGQVYKYYNLLVTLPTLPTHIFQGVACNNKSL